MFNALTLVALYLALLPSAFAQSVYDDFEDGVLDPQLWVTNGPGTLTEENGRAVSRDRGHLASVQEFDPNVSGIHIVGSFTFMSQNQYEPSIELVWRAEQGQTHAYGQAHADARLAFSSPNSSYLTDVTEVFLANETAVLNSAAFTVSFGETVLFDVTDNAGSVTAQVINVSTGQSVTISAQLSANNAYGNYFKFYGREAPYSTTVGLDEISISSLASFTVVREHAPGFSGASRYESCIVVGDLTGDGIPEYGVADIDSTPQLEVFDGASGSLYLTISGTSEHFGMSGCTHPDINGDGISDFAIGESENDTFGFNAGRVLVFSGADGTLLRTISGPATSAVDQGFGWNLASFVDVNGDGIDELLVGAKKGGTGGHYSGSVTCVNGADGTHIYTVHGAGSYDYASSIGSYGPDINGDGVPEFGIGARENFGGSGGGYLRVVSGLDGTILQTIQGWGSQMDSFGASHAWTDDLDADGFADIVVAAPGEDSYGIDVGRVGVFSSVSGLLIREIIPLQGVVRAFGGSNGGNWGSNILQLPDSDGDGFSEVLIPVTEFDDGNNICSAVLVCSPASGLILNYLTDPAGAITGFGDSIALLTTPSLSPAQILLSGYGVGQAYVYEYDFMDLDVDNDGLLDINEVLIHGTNPNLMDTDGDGLGDGQELGMTLATVPPDTNLNAFVPDADPLTTTNPLAIDSDAGGVEDGIEDQNLDGAINTWETDPNSSADDDFAFFVKNFEPGQRVVFEVYQAAPSASWIFPVYSLAGAGPTNLSIGITVELSAPMTALTPFFTDSAGRASVVGPRVPAGAPLGIPVYWQAVEVPFSAALTPSVSNAIKLPVGSN